MELIQIHIFWHFTFFLAGLRGKPIPLKNGACHKGWPGGVQDEVDFQPLPAKWIQDNGEWMKLKMDHFETWAIMRLKHTCWDSVWFNWAKSRTGKTEAWQIMFILRLNVFHVNVTAFERMSWGSRPSHSVQSPSKCSSLHRHHYLQPEELLAHSRHGFQNKNNSRHGFQSKNNVIWRGL